jgi:hypothetical protein
VQELKLYDRAGRDDARGQVLVPRLSRLGLEEAEQADGRFM